MEMAIPVHKQETRKSKHIKIYVKVSRTMEIHICLLDGQQQRFP